MIAFTFRYFILFLSFSVLARTVDQGEVIIFRIQGGTMRSYVNDELKVYSEGRTELKTISPFPYSIDHENLIGHSTGKVSREVYFKLLQQGSAYIKANSTARALPHDSVAVGLSIETKGKTVTAVWPLSDGPKVKELEKLFYEIKQASQAVAISSLALKCTSPKSKPIACTFSNLGIRDLRTVNPLEVSESIACLEKTGKKTVLNDLKVYDPRKMSPSTIVLKPKQVFEFKIQVKAPCRGRIVVKNTNMMINKAYAGFLLGESISNTLLH